MEVYMGYERPSLPLKPRSWLLGVDRSCTLVMDKQEHSRPVEKEDNPWVHAATRRFRKCSQCIALPKDFCLGHS